MWTIVFLAMGGIALGQGVMSSGLLKVVDVILRDMIDGYSLYRVVLIISPVVLVREALTLVFPSLPVEDLTFLFTYRQIISTFISHTIASLLLVPIAKEVGSSLPDHHQNLLIFITGLICSAGMGMPVSGFPNQTALVYFLHVVR
jgi:phosphate transporter